VICTGQTQWSSSQRSDSIGSTQGSTKSVTNPPKNLPEIVPNSPDKVPNLKTSATKLHLSSSTKSVTVPKVTSSNLTSPSTNTSNSNNNCMKVKVKVLSKLVDKPATKPVPQSVSACTHHSVSTVTGCESTYSRKDTETLEKALHENNAVMSLIVKYRSKNRRTQAQYRQRQNKKMKVNASNELIPTAAKSMSIESELLDRRLKEAKETLEKKRHVMEKSKYLPK